jgi:hypothetical protein
MPIPRIASLGRAAVAATAAVLAASPAAADTLVRARVVVDATNPSAVVLKESLDWTAQGGTTRTDLAFFLARAVDVTEVRSEGAALTVRSEDVAGAPLRKWVVRPSVPLASGATRTLDVTATVASGAVPGIQVDANGGFLLPGSGWFPALAAETDEILPHTTEFRLPAGWSGIACGTRPQPQAPWSATSPGRPYAAWGEYRTEDATSGEARFTTWRRASGPVPRLDQVAKLISNLQVAMGEAPGGGPWKLVDVGHAVAAGGQRTLFYDEAVVAAAKVGELTTVDRDLASGLAAAHWDEAMRFFGSQAAWLSGAFPRYLGDVALLTEDRSDDSWRTERRLIGDRRTTFLAKKVADRPLKGLSPHAPEAPAILDGRGALVVHKAAEACPTKAYWISFLREFRGTHDGERVEWPDLQRELEKKLPGQHKFLPPFLETTGVPDFVVSSHGPSSKGSQGQRYRVEVKNLGRVAAYAEVACYTSKDVLMRTTRLFVEPGQARAVLFGDARLIGRIRIDPRGTTLQSSVEGEQVDVKSTASTAVADYVPAFEFSVGEPAARRVHGLRVELDGITITNFDGTLQWWETRQGPSGAVLLGTGHVTIAPTGEFSAPFKAAMGKDRVEFDGTDFFVRFPLATWQKLQPQLGEAIEASEAQAQASRRIFMYDHCFPTFFADKGRAQVPPPGGALVIFGLGGGEFRGFVRQPLPDGHVQMRMWDHLRGTVVWESTL